MLNEVKPSLRLNYLQNLLANSWKFSDCLQSSEIITPANQLSAHHQWLSVGSSNNIFGNNANTVDNSGRTLNSGWNIF